MAHSRITIRIAQAGWVVYFDDNTKDFYPFRSDEGTRLVEFVLEKGLGIKVDFILDARQEYLTAARAALEAKQDDSTSL